MSSPISPYTGTGVALITGSSQGIGKAIALRLAQDGFDIALNDIAAKVDQLKEVEKEIQGMGKRTVVITADVSSEDEVQRMVDTVAQVLGGLDVVSFFSISLWLPR
jgi:NAD(P)-dependent dehydrogenase (short-subunit alcohol dehydrogenase family)